MKKIVLFTVLALAVTGCATNNVKSHKVELTSYEETDNILCATLEYPRIKGSEKLNSEIKKEVEQKLEEFTIYAKENNDGSYPYEIDLNSEVYFNDNLISVKLVYYTFTGGNHGEENIKTFNYDKRKKEYLDASALSHFTLEELSDITESSLTFSIMGDNINKDEEILALIKEGTKPVNESFQDFVIKDGQLVIYFDNLRIPHSAGIPTVTIAF